MPGILDIANVDRLLSRKRFTVGTGTCKPTSQAHQWDSPMLEGRAAMDYHKCTFSIEWTEHYLAKNMIDNGWQPGVRLGRGQNRLVG